MLKSLFLILLLLPGQILAEDSFTVSENDDTLTIRYGAGEVLTYHKSPVPPPPGADPALTRSGFIHPLRTPGGSLLTGIHPADHVHHLGLWHAWVHTEHDGREIDFWNLAGKTGTVRYAGTLDAGMRDGSAGFTVLQEHVADPGPESEEVILRERLSVYARLVDGAFEIDYETRQTNITGHTLNLPAYRYGGTIAYRAPAAWNGSNSDYLSSEGRTRADGHATRSRWCAMWGPGNEGVVHLAILGHPDNHDAPQRMRVWPPGEHGGAVFFVYVPIQETAWRIEPGETSVMRYRLVARDATVDPQDLERRWARFAGE